MPFKVWKYLQERYNLLKYTQTLFLVHDTHGERAIGWLQRGKQGGLKVAWSVRGKDALGSMWSRDIRHAEKVSQSKREGVRTADYERRGMPAFFEQGSYEKA